MVQLAPSGTREFQYQAALVNEAGRTVGTVAGYYRLGDGATTYISNDRIPYTRVLEGLYEYTLDNGTRASDAFSLIDH
jgi:hypothetical protein